MVNSTKTDPHSNEHKNCFTCKALGHRTQANHKEQSIRAVVICSYTGKKLTYACAVEGCRFWEWERTARIIHESDSWELG